MSMSHIQRIRQTACNMAMMLEDSTQRVGENRDRIAELCKSLPANTVDQCIVKQCVHLASMILDYEEAKDIHLRAEANTNE